MPNENDKNTSRLVSISWLPCARATLKPNPDDTLGYIITLERRQKKLFVPAVAQFYQAIVTVGRIWCATWMPEQPISILNSNIAGLPARNIKP